MIGKFTKKLAALCFSYGLAALVLFPSGLWAQCPFQAGFTASNVYPCAGDTVSFTNTTTMGATGYSWFQDISFFSTALSPTRVFPTPGTYGVSVIASNGMCADTATKIVVVNPVVTASIVGTDASCNGFSDGAADLTPASGTPNLSLDNIRATSDYVEANSVASAGYSSGVTVEAWVRPRSTWTTGDGHITAFNIFSGGNRFFFGYNAQLQKYVFFDSNLGNQFQNGAISPRGQWSHVALTIDLNNVVRMYVNGVLRKTVTTNAGWQPQAGDLFSIGQEWDLPNTSQHFDGNIDEVRIWNTSLTAATVASNFNNSCASISSSHPNINNLVAYYSMNEGSGAFIFDRSGNDNHGTRSGAAWGLPADNNYGCFISGTGYAYNWSNSSTAEDISSLSAGTYTVTVTDGAGCMVIDTVIIDEPAPVVVSIASNPSDSICLGDTTQLTASGAVTYAWSSTGGISGTSGATVSAFPSTTNTSYQVIGVDGTGCADTTSTAITVNTLPTAAIAGDTVICNGDSSQLTASGGGSYAWSNMASTAATTVLPTATTTYTVTVTDANGCEDDAQITVAVNALPTVAITGTDSICDGDSTTLTATGGATYAWSNGGMMASTTVNPTVNTVYAVIVTDSNTCVSSDSVEVVVSPLPVISISGDDTICAGETAMLSAAGGSMYAWSTGDMVATTSVTPTSNTTYSVMVSTAAGCAGSDSIEVIVNPAPTTAITGIDTVCAGDSTLLTATGGGTYSWSNGATTATTFVAPVNTGNFSVTVTNGDGCTDSDTIQVFVNTQLIAKITPDTTQVICEGASIDLSGTGGTSLLWSTGDTNDSITVSPSVSTTYFLTVSDGSSCDGMDTLEVIVNPAPVPVVVQTGNSLTTTQAYSSYMWFQTGSSTVLSVNSVYPLTMDGTYYVEVTDSNGCTAISDSSFVLGREELVDFPLGVTVFPNPNKGRFTLQLDSDHSRDVDVAIFDVLGHQVYHQKLKTGAGRFSEELDLQRFAKGVYILQLVSEGRKSHHKVIVE